MKKRVVFSFLLSVLGFSLHAQTFVFQAKPEGSKKWGYCGIDGELIIPAEYDKTFAFSKEGLAAVYNSKEKQYAFINLKNERLATEETKFALNEVFGFRHVGFQEGLVMVKINGKWGFMDVKGKLIIPAKYTAAIDFNGGYALVKNGDQTIILDKAGNETVLTADISQVKEFSEGLAPFRSASNEKFGFINTKGEIQIEATYEGVGYFSNGLAWARTADQKIGFINKQGEWVIKPEYAAAKDFDLVHGLALVRKGEQWIYVDKSGKELTISDSEKLNSFSEGLAEGKKGGLFGFYDKTGKWVIEPQFQGVGDFSNGYAYAKSGDLWGIINKKGEWVVKPKFSAVKSVTKVN